MSYCGRCRAKIDPPGAEYCSNCGTPTGARPATEACRACGTVISTSARRCPHCGEENPTHAMAVRYVQEAGATIVLTLAVFAALAWGLFR